MQIYNIAKYENISDRIKRLASSSKPLTQAPQIVSPKQMPRNQLNRFSKNQNIPIEFTSRFRYEQKQSESRVTTQQTEEKSEQQSLNLIGELMSFRQNRTNRTLSREQILKNIKGAQKEPQHTIYQNVECSTFRRLVQTKEIEDEEKPSLTNIKSENSLKIDEILSNYNNYKQNKQQFLQSINKSSNQNHQKNNSENLKEYFGERQGQNYQKKKIIKEEAFGDIENIWNQKLEKQDSPPKFMRSQNDKNDRFSELSQILSSELIQKPEAEVKLDSLGKGKFLFKRLEQKKESDQKQLISQRNLVLSPRGLRVPGKICKNNDKSFGVLPRYK